MALKWRRLNGPPLYMCCGSLGKVDIYLEDWSERSEVRTEDWIETGWQGQVDKSNRKEQDKLNKERVEAWRPGQSLIVVASSERSQNKVEGRGQNKHKEEKIILKNNKGSRQRAGGRND